MMNRVIEHRRDLATLCNDLGLLTAAEIGTHQGVFADEFMDRYIGTLYCVDSWCDAPIEPNPIFLPAFVPQALGRDFDEAVAKLVLGHKYKDRVSFMKMNSLEAAAEFADGSLGFVYIDGAHDVKNVKADLQAWWPKVRPGGIMAGHDYCPSDPTLAGVSIVVNWFVIENELDLNLTREGLPSWYLIKP